MYIYILSSLSYLKQKKVRKQNHVVALFTCLQVHVSHLVDGL